MHVAPRLAQVHQWPYRLCLRDGVFHIQHNYRIYKSDIRPKVDTVGFTWTLWVPTVGPAVGVVLHQVVMFFILQVRRP